MATFPHCFLTLVPVVVACHGAVSPAPKPYELVDLTPAFLAYYDTARALPPDQRTTLFKRSVASRLPDFYTPGTPGRDLDSKAVDRAVDDFPLLQHQFVLLPPRLAAILPPVVAGFRNAFPDLQPLGKVYLLHSLGTLDGGTRTIAGEPHLILGLDMIARLHHTSNEGPFLHHELFHLYHSRFFRDCQGMWCNLWREGLAVYVASRLNPGASDEELGLTSPLPLRAPIEGNLPAVVCTVRARLDSLNNAPYFSAGRTLNGFPPRFGYFVGYLAAAKAAESHALPALAHLGPGDARPVLEAALAALAGCP